MWSCKKKKLIEEKKHVKIIEHEKLHFNCEIGQERLEQLNRFANREEKMLK
jgi:hypothetical protein